MFKIKSVSQSVSQSVQNYKKIIYFIVSFAILFILSKLLLRGTGLYPSPPYIDILLMSLFIVFMSASRKSFYFLLIPIITILALYTPIGLNFGNPKYQHIISFFATDVLESKEFLQLIPFKHYIYSVAIIILLVSYWKIITKYKINLYSNKLFIALSTLVVFYKLSPLMFFQETFKEYQKVRKELDTLNQFVNESNWKKSELTNSKYDDYILIIGESVRSDYMHAYGYPIENTPFMSNSNGILVNGLLASGGYTIGSLKHMLTKSDKTKWKENYSLNIVDMAKSAGIKTYWISNQGFIGKWDSPITSIANRADIKEFLKSGEYNSKNTSDFELLSKFKTQINKKSANKRLFILHLYGSHPNACDRISDYKKIYNDSDILPENTYINCYISSIKKTDEFIEKIFRISQEQNRKSDRKFSIIYFSDHGLGHKKIKDKIILNNDPNVAKGLEYHTVPLFKVSSDDTEKFNYHTFKSGLNFTDGIANWIGIKNPNIDPSINLFDNKNDPSDYGQKQKIQSKTPDPAVDIRPNK